MVSESYGCVWSLEETGPGDSQVCICCWWLGLAFLDVYLEPCRLKLSVVCKIRLDRDVRSRRSCATPFFSCPLLTYVYVLCIFLLTRLEVSNHHVKGWPVVALSCPAMSFFISWLLLLTLVDSLRFEDSLCSILDVDAFMRPWMRA